MLCFPQISMYSAQFIVEIDIDTEITLLLKHIETVVT